MVKHKITRRLISQFFMKNEEGTVYEIEDFMIGRNKNIPDRRTISGIMSRDPKYMVVRIVRRKRNVGYGGMVRIWGLNKEV